MHHQILDYKPFSQEVSAKLVLALGLEETDLSGIEKVNKVVSDALSVANISKNIAKALKVKQDQIENVLRKEIAWVVINPDDEDQPSPKKTEKKAKKKGKTSKTKKVSSEEYENMTVVQLKSLLKKKKVKFDAKAKRVDLLELLWDSERPDKAKTKEDVIPAAFTPENFSDYLPNWQDQKKIKISLIWQQRIDCVDVDIEAIDAEGLITGNEEEYEKLRNAISYYVYRRVVSTNRGTDPEEVMMNAAKEMFDASLRKQLSKVLSFETDTGNDT